MAPKIRSGQGKGQGKTNKSPGNKGPSLPVLPEEAKKILSELASTLDLKATLIKFNMTIEEGKTLFAAFLRDASSRENAPAASGVGGGSAKKSPSGKMAGKNPPANLAGGTITIYVDGASRGNPGLAGAGAIFRDSEGAVVRRLTRYLGVATNNVAEYEALILALEEAAPMTDSVRVFADSELMVKQIKGIYRVKNEALKGLYAIATKLIESFSSFEISHVRREFNSEADQLANEAIDKRDA